MLSAQQREAIRRQSTADLVWLLVPGGGWRNRILTADQGELGSLRRQLMLVVGLAAAAAGMAIWWSSEREGSVADRGRPDPPPIDRSSASRPESAPAPAPPIPAQTLETAPTPPAVSEPTLTEKRTQIALFSSAKVNAVYEGHDVHGVRVDNVGPGSFWDLVGVRSGDVVIEHNGAPVDNPATMVALLNSMEQDPVVRLRVRSSDGEERTLYYSAPR